MVLSRRERYVLIGTLVAVGALAADRLVMSPLLNRVNETQARRDNLLSELERAKTLLSYRHDLAPRWRQMVQTGMKNDPAEAESQVLHAIRDWAEESGLSLSLLKPDRLTEKTRLPEIGFQASGTGTMNGVARFLWRARTASIPIKVAEVQISARKEGTDDLSFQLRLSTVYAPARPATAATAAARSDGAN
jgi:hypothetical protein